MDPARIAAAITPRTKAIIPVHLYGQPVDMDAVMAIAQAHGLKVIEDAAQALGASYRGRKVCAIGDCGCISFFPSKNLGAFGDGGMIVTDDPALADRMRMVAAHGSRVRYYHEVLGVNSRLDTMQAAILRAKLPHLQQWTDERRERAALYSKLLEGVPGLITPKEAPGAKSAWHLYTVRTAKRDGLIEELKKNGISTAVHYPRPIHLQPAMAPAGGKVGDLPVSENLSHEVVCLPLYPELPLADVQRIASVVRNFLSA
jgi:dTDP-4-amino-4,6-dideoxygalactose transaminase